MSTGTDSEQRTGFTSREPEASYRPIAQLAIVSFVFGVLSLLAFAGIIFWVVPLIALPLAGFTSRQLERTRNEYAGQLLAKAALFLALIAMVGAPTRFGIEWFILTREAKTQADQMIDLVLAGRIKEAFYQSTHPLSRTSAKDSLDQLIVRSGEGYRDFLDGEFVRLFNRQGKEAQVTYEGTAGYGSERGFTVVLLKYRITLEDHAYDVRVLMKGGVASSNEWQGRQWYAETTAVADVKT